MFQLRHLEERDYARVRPLLNSWADGANLLPLFPRHVFTHFANTQFLAVQGAEPCGIISGFLSQTRSEEAYVRVIALARNVRSHGLGRDLYQRFFKAAGEYKRIRVRAITSPDNRASIAFHRALGFVLEPGDHEIEGVSVHRDYAAQGEHRVLMVKHLDD